MPFQKRILIIDDEPDMLRDATDLLREQGYEVAAELDPIKGLEKIRKGPPDLVLLDVQMPQMDGLEVCRQIKANPQLQSIPVIMVSIRTHESLVVAALEIGAEDYIRKPYQEAEFLARIRRALKRGEPASSSRTVSIGPFVLNHDEYQLTINGSVVPLRPKVFELLAFFIRREGHVLTHAVISENVWQTPFNPTSRTIYFHVNLLRKELGKYGYFIESLKGIGYRFEIPE